MKKKLIIAGVVIGAIAVIYVLSRSSATLDASKQIIYEVKRSDFGQSVKATGELQAKNSKRILGPPGLQQLGIYNTTIDNLIPEGTVVKKGDFIASLNRNELANKLTEASTEIDRVMTQLEQARIDTAIDLRGLRDQIDNLEFSLREKELLVSQSQFEPEMVIRQAQLDLEKAERDLRQTKENLKLKKQQAKAKIEEISTLLRQQQNKMNRLNEAAAGFTIMAPEDGMLIYYRTWSGKITSGSQINAWDPVIAELPDLTDMITKSYVNEVDINKIRVGLDADVKVDALPDRVFAGKVISVANVGEELRSFDSKVFEVKIQIMEVDTLMRPSMTTGAEIYIDELKDVIAVPMDALDSDSLTYVYKLDKGRLVRQEVITGVSSDMKVVIAHGLEEGDEIYLNAPENKDDLPTVFIDEAIKANIQEQLQQEKEARQKRWAEKAEEAAKISDSQNSSESGSGGGIIIFN